jgi:MFS family permease
MISGVFSDWLGKRKILIVLGYLCGALSKPMFAFCNGLGLYIFAQSFERITNGLRDTPRDALIADCAPKELKGKSYGARQFCAFTGSMIGSLFTLLIMCHFGSSEFVVRMIYLVAAIPLAISVLLLCYGVKEPKGIVSLKRRKGFPIKRKDIEQLGRSFWYYLFICFIFLCSRFSETFLIWRAQNLGLDVTYAPLVLVVMYAFNAPTAWIVGKWSDKRERKLFLSFGFCMLLASSIVLTTATNAWQALIGVAFYGIHFGATHGTFYAVVSDYAPPQIKGTSIGIFNLTYCVGLSVANILTGWMCASYGAETAFVVNAAISLVASIGILFIRPNKANYELNAKLED